MNIIPDLVKNGTAIIIDVRTRAEFMGGHVVGSVNIPLPEISDHLDELKEKKNIILCCASGNRSGQAARFLQQNGIACQNGGSWMDLNAITNQIVNQIS